MKIISIGVRDFALPSPRTGSIDSQSGYGPLPVTGQEVHNAFLNKRKKAIADYQLEVKLTRRFTHRGYDIRVSGRVDGLIVDSNNGDEQQAVVLEEVKTDFEIYRLASILKTNPDHPYMMQLKSYGYFYSQEHRQDCELKIVLVSIKDGTTLTVPVHLDIDQYERWLDRRLSEIVCQYEAVIARQKDRALIAENIQFPFDNLRPGQQDLIDTIKDTVGKSATSIIQAPTGLGKTIGTLFPALESSLASGDQVIYVTAKNSQHEAVANAVNKINSKNPVKKIKALVLTAKSKVCLKEEVLCNSDYCEYARDYYKKLDENKVVDSVWLNDLVTGDSFIEMGKKHKVCPFELSLDCIDQADIVVGDYNYVFSPRNIMGRFRPLFTEKVHKPVLLVDEAHNLPDRAKSYYSSQITEQELLELKVRIEDELPSFSIRAQALIHEILAFMRSYAGGGRYSVKQIEIDKEGFEKIKQSVSNFSTEYMSASVSFLNKDPILRLNSLVTEFGEILSNNGSEFVQILKSEKGGMIKIACLDAANKISEAYSRIRSTVLFSATLKPFEYYRKVLGVDENLTSDREFDSPFPEKNRKLLVVPQVSTKYSDRPRNYSKISEAIKRITQVKKGNYVVFFPSFQFLEEVLSITRLGDTPIIAQRRNMLSNEVKNYLNKLREADSNLVLFAVQGGIFSEGIDYSGSMLIGTIIVGPGLPKYDLETQLLQTYFDEKHGLGYKFTFVYPAMTKVIQSAGRVIRSEDEVGLLVLLGRRFTTPDFREAMPDYWIKRGAASLVSTSILKDINTFWADHSSKGIV